MRSTATCSLCKRDVRSMAACSLCKRDVRSDKKILHNKFCKDEELLLENIDDIIVRNRSSKGLEDFEDTRIRDALLCNACQINLRKVENLKED